MLHRTGLNTEKFFIVGAHREENIDSERNMTDMVETLNNLAETYDMPVIVSSASSNKEKVG